MVGITQSTKGNKIIIICISKKLAMPSSNNANANMNSKSFQYKLIES